jgi:hypothetical protein
MSPGAQRKEDCYLMDKDKDVNAQVELPDFVVLSCADRSRQNAELSAKR